ncbi:MAG TPA: sensor histidine kinase [Saprospiraceae bacterium]|nr:sensor histidine kinase [Saprospiraceae bacterium]HNT19151.1 sensor histidine kinase [Saprospiraceae bacterium]
MQALRARMNPHFIFNCLNSINNFILKNEQAKASEFLLKFSKLIRHILQNSMFPLITLDQELEALRLYIEIEALRFHQQFEYRIRLGDGLDSMSIRVTPLIYQPFVENAIHHGLLPKEGPGHLELEIFEEGESLVCLVRDDGVGRPEQALQAAQPAGHKSLGIRLTTERIGLLPIPDRSIRPVTIQDLTDAMGKPAGTEVRIQTPLQV